MLPTDNYLWANCPGGNCPVGSRPGWELSRGEFSGVGTVRGGNYLGGNCPWGTRPGGSCPGGNCPGGTCPGGSCPVTVLLILSFRKLKRLYRFCFHGISDLTHNSDFFLIAIYFFNRDLPISRFADISITSKGSRFYNQIKQGIAIFYIFTLSPMLN